MTQKLLNPKPDPSIPVVIPPAIPNELSGPQTQALLYGYTIDDTTAKALGLSHSYEVCIVLAEELSRLNLEGYYNSYGRSMKDDLHLLLCDQVSFERPDMDSERTRNDSIVRAD
ncbi:hypothetical protein BT96DRAFT_1009834 [Gymnopus androsaceus JB14]|uniref:Uncharacterized protein n=1 Tax=Gymnopus androsaceus JB14 TaxID=1447944 RepID=A0A6A4GBU4_9AGAR|nr:hypothetical protein BT96DRAFT_1009834 [Gymnopus androsaceus JB14]